MTQNLPTQQAKTPVDRLKQVMSSPSVQEQFKNALADKSNMFVASVIDLYASDTYLQNCNPATVVMECLKAATLNLPINKSLGFAYVIPYAKSVKVGNKWEKQVIPQFQLGYKGMIQLAMRTGQYKYINADAVYAGEYKGFSKLTGELDISGEAESDEVVGYFAHIETVNGFKKSLYMTRANMEKHGEKYSKSYSKDSSPWKTEFDGMAIKTMIRMLLGKYGIMSIDMADAMAMDKEPEQDVQYLTEANRTMLDIDNETGEILNADHSGSGGMSPEEIAKIAEEESKMSQPSFDID